MSAFQINKIHCKCMQAEQLKSKCVNQYEDDRFSLIGLINKIYAESRIDCVVASTYRYDIEWIRLQFEPIFRDKIPFLLLHGDRKINNHRASLSEPHFLIEEVTPRLPRATQRVSAGIEAPAAAEDKHHTGEPIPGVHHSKYVLIFTEEALWVVISTANLTFASSVDATWHQKFDRITPSEATSSVGSSSTSANSNDFGVVLADFMRSQSDQLKRNVGRPCLHVLQWIHSHTSVHDLAACFDFAPATARLVSTVPGRFVDASDNFAKHMSAADYCSPCLKELDKTRCHSVKYGLERLREVIRWGVRDGSNDDCLYIQPTSIGNGVSNQYMAQLLSKCLPEDYWSAAGVERQDSYRLIWPDKGFVSACHSCADETRISTEFRVTQDSDEEDDGEAETSGAGLFLRSESLAKMEPDIHSQMSRYAPIQHFEHRPPHIKCMLRAKGKSHHDGCGRRSVQWMLLTSASLSHGALGRDTYSNKCSTDCYMRQRIVEYKNFELGVIFTPTSNKDLYIQTESCSRLCDTRTHPAATLLPIPFKLNSDHYFDSNFQVLHTPYFSHTKPGVFDPYGAWFEVGMKRKRNISGFLCNSVGEDDKENRQNRHREDVTPAAVANGVDFLCD